MVTGCRVVKLDVTERRVELSNGLTVNYDKCLIATGNQNAQLAIVQYFIKCRF